MVLQAFRDVRFQAAALYYLLVLGVSAHFAVAYITGTDPLVKVAEFMGGQAKLPFQYRALPAWLLWLIAHSPPVRFLSGHLPPPFSDPGQLAWLALALASMLGLVETSRRIIRLFLPDESLARLCSLLTVWAAYVSYVTIANIYRYSYPYDLPALLLFSLAYLMAAKRDTPAFYVCFALATLARETSVFLIPAFCCLRWASARAFLRHGLAHAAALLAIWAVLKLGLWLLYRGNPVESGEAGGVFVMQLSQNLHNLGNPIYWPNILSAAGWLWLPVLLWWRHLDHPGLRRSLLVVAPAYVCGMLLVGRITEVRIFAELIPLLVPALSVIIRNRLAMQPATGPAGAP